MRFTLAYLPDALAELAVLWLDSTDRAAVSRASDLIDRELRDSPDTKGDAVEGSLRKIVAHPLVFYYVISPADRLATVWSVRPARP
jgi:hypothetical protein